MGNLSFPDMLVKVMEDFCGKMPIWMQQLECNTKGEHHDYIRGTFVRLCKKMWKFLNKLKSERTETCFKSASCYKILLHVLTDMSQMLNSLKTDCYELRMLLSLYNSVLKWQHEEPLCNQKIIELLHKISGYIQQSHLVNLSTVNEDLPSSGFCGTAPAAGRVMITKSATLLLLQVCSLLQKNGKCLKKNGFMIKSYIKYFMNFTIKRKTVAGADSNHWLCLLKKLSEKTGQEVLPSVLVSLYQEQDDQLIEIMLCLLNIYIRFFHKFSL